MPWNESNLKDERIKFVARLLDGENMSAMCREFGISRKTGYKKFNRYKDCGLEGLQDQSRRPYHNVNKLPVQVERTIVRIRKERPTWGASKIRAKLIREYPMIKPPAKSTVHAALERHGMVKRRKSRRYRAKGTNLRDAKSLNGPWCADYKGQFPQRNPILSICVRYRVELCDSSQDPRSFVREYKLSTKVEIFTDAAR